MDVLEDVVSVTRIRGRVFCRTELPERWGLEFPPFDSAVFHVVARGELWLRLTGQEDRRRISAGDVVLVAHGSGHCLSSHPEEPAVLFERYFADPGRPPPSASGVIVLCGVYKFEADGRHPLFSVLPPVVHVRAADEQPPGQLAAIVQLLEHEQRSAGPGTETVTARLVDLVFLSLIRRWIAAQPEGSAGWLGATRDERIGRVLAAIHERPAESWTLDELAGIARMSRAAFVRRFQALAGEPPMGYLGRWRLSLASALLKHTELSVAQVAARVGYSSEFAFSKAFRRERGASPTQYRSAVGRPALTPA